MLVAFAKNQTLVAEGAPNDALVYTDPQPMGGSNYVEAVVNTEVFYHTGSGTPGLTVSAEGSNDGQNWVAISAVSISVSSTGKQSDGDYATFAFLRFKFQLAIASGSGGDIAVATFDLHVNLIQK